MPEGGVESIAGGLEVVEGAEAGDDVRGGGDVVEDGLDGFVGHGALIEGGLVGGGGVDAGHGLAEGLDGEDAFCLCAARQAAGAVGRGLIPVVIALADTNQTAIAHIDGNQEAFAGPGGDGAFAQNPGLEINIVMDGGEAVFHIQAQAFNQGVDHGVAIELGEALHQAHVVQVVLEVGTGNIGQGLRNQVLVFGAEVRDERLDFLPAPGGFELGDGGIKRLTAFLGEVAPGECLVILGDFEPRVATAGVDDEIEVAVIVAVDLDEVVAAAERADAADGAGHRHGLGAPERPQVELLHVRVGRIADAKAGGDGFLDEGIKGGQVEVALAQADGLHATPDVHAHQIGDDFVGDGHGGTDGAPRAGMDIRNLAAGDEGLVAEGLNLRKRLVVHLVGEHLGIRIRTLNLNHGAKSIKFSKKISSHNSFRGKGYGPPKTTSVGNRRCSVASLGRPCGISQILTDLGRATARRTLQGSLEV